MFYYNRLTKEFGLRHMDVQKKYPNLTLPAGFTSYGDFTAYEATEKPDSEYATVEEVFPVKGKQTWRKTWRTDVDNVIVEIKMQIDEACGKLMDQFNRFRGEYEIREREAKAFKENNYQGSAGPLLTGLANKILVTPKEAANMVLDQSSVLRALEIEVGDLRMMKLTITNKLTIPQMIARRNTVYLRLAEIAEIAKNV